MKSLSNNNSWISGIGFYMLILIIHYAPLFAQTQNKFNLITKDEHVVIDQQNNYKIFHKNSAEEVDIIVEFKKEPLFLQLAKGNVTQPAKNEYANIFSECESDISAILFNRAKHLNIYRNKIATIQSKFYKVFFGVSAKVPAGLLADISHLPYVKKIHMNLPVEIHLLGSIPLIRADRVWEEYGTKGEGVVVGVIDSGIDYLHPALGGGIGPGFKVIGGYDFVNDDNDPMDDNNHGTHVSGIIAANTDSIKGVAPEASLLAVKVVNSKGRALSSTIIEGIEYIVDPNQDGDFSDMVDIANISLGSVGTPDDPKSTAVNNASQLGVLFCISAGNEGDYKMIGSPGLAASAITVGATTKSDAITTFSSKGPAIKTYSIKPDLVAPGQNITSTITNNRYESFNGTSMSTPHVSGVCALIKAVHPDWDAQMIKSVVLTSAIDLNLSPMVQGSGRLDALRAIQQSTIASPTNLSFGIDNDSVSIWNATSELNVKNMFESSQDYSIELINNNNGVEITAEPSFFTLVPGSNQNVNINLSVNNSLVPYKNEGSDLSYWGEVYIYGDVDTLHIPMSFSKILFLRISFDEPRSRFYIASTNNAFEGGTYQSDKLDEYTYDLVFPSSSRNRTFNLVALMESFDVPKLIINENLRINYSSSINITNDQANNLIRLDGSDDLGNKFNELNFAETNHYSRILLSNKFIPSLSYFISDISPTDSIFVSNFSSNYTLYPSESYNTLGTTEKIYCIQHKPIKGLTNNSVVLTNNQGDYESLNVKVYSKPDEENPYVGFLQGFLYRSNSSINPVVFNVASVVAAIPFDENFWEGRLFLTPAVDQNYITTINLLTTLNDNLSDGDFRPLQSKFFRVVEEQIACFNTHSPSPYDFIGTTKDTIVLGVLPIRNQVEISYDDQHLLAYIDPYGQLDEIRHSDFRFMNFNIYDQNKNLIRSGDFKIGEDDVKTFVYEEIGNPGIYNLELITEQSFFENRNTKAVYNGIFDTRNPDHSPPIISSLILTNKNGKIADHIEKDESIYLRFSAKNNFKGETYSTIMSDSTKLFLKYSNEEDWIRQDYIEIDHDYNQSQGFTPLGHVYKSDLTNWTIQDSAFVDIKVVFQDPSGNRAEWSLVPAFMVGEYGIYTSGDFENTVPTQYKLYNNYPNPFNSGTTIKFDVASTTPVELKIYDILGEEIKTFNYNKLSPGSYSFFWDGRNEYNTTVGSGIYFYSISAGNFIESKKMIFLK